MADDPNTISLQDFISRYFGKGVSKDLQASYIDKLNQFFPSGQMPRTAMNAAYGFLGGGGQGQSNIYGAILENLGQGQASSSGQGAGAGGQTVPTTGAGVGAGASYYQYNPATGTYSMAPAATGQSGTVTGAAPMANTAAQIPLAAKIPLNVSLPEWQTWFGQNVGKQIMVNGQVRTIGTDLSPDQALTAFRNQSVSWDVPTPTPTPTVPTYFGAGATAAPPESVALSQMSQIDPASEALRQQLASSYGTPLAQAGQPPNAANLQSYLNAYQQLDPKSYALMQGLPAQYASYLAGTGGALSLAQKNMALGSTLDPTTQIQVEQAARAAQGARGNVYGVAPAVEEAMTQGQAGLALQQQRYQNLLSALSTRQGGLGAGASYLASGTTPGGTALSLYQQQLANLRGAQQGAQSYLGSGVTPYQAGAGYLANAQQAGAQASQGGYAYQPSALGASPYSYLNPNYGLSFGQNVNQTYQNMLQGYGYGLAGQQQQGGGLMGAGVGALGGAASGALMGAAAGGVGAIPGALIGALGGAAKGYFS